MRKVLAIAAMVIGCSLSAFCWNCSVAGEVRVQVPLSYTGSGTGDGNNQVVEQGGLNFVCEALPTATTTPSTTTNTNTNNSTSGATSGSTSTSGANATGGSVNNSGNSSNKNTNMLTNTNTLANTQKQSQGQSQSNSSTNANQSTGGSVENVGNEQTIVQRSAPPALGPTIFPSGCNGSISGGASAPFGGISIGGTKQDHHCQQMQTAAMFLSQGNLEAATRILCRTWAARDAKLTLDECRLIAKAQVPVVVVPIVSTPAPAPIKVEITNNIPPAPAPIILHEEMTVTAPRPQAKKRATHKPCSVTEIQNQCAVKTQEK